MATDTTPNTSHRRVNTTDVRRPGRAHGSHTRTPGSAILRLERDITAMMMDPDPIDATQGRALLRELLDTVTRLTRTERQARVARLIAGSIRRLEAARQLAETDGGTRRVAAVVTMFSGGNDSTVLAHLFRQQVTHIGMATTGIGINQTRQYVQHRAADWGCR
jgi:3'-phosphoadenosine 5'-phosphosulfate sulfotransferase (PAPS reductase)/FAD synthetase